MAQDKPETTGIGRAATDQGITADELRKWQSKEPCAINRLVVEHMERLYAETERSCRGKSIDILEPREFVTDAFLRITLHPPQSTKILDREQFQNFLTLVIRGLILDAQRKSAVRASESLNREDTDFDVPAPPENPGPDPDLVARYLDTALTFVTEKQRRVLGLRRRGLTYREISERTGQSEEAVRMTYARAMKTLGQKFQEVDDLAKVRVGDSIDRFRDQWLASTAIGR